jgi:ubiquinone/menaquinone biosynthesis C-methylase UbiE
VIIREFLIKYEIRGYMVKPRTSETGGIQGDFNVETYDKMLSRLRDKGWMETDEIIKSGIDEGLVLEIGPGPGYLGLEWLRKTERTRLKAIEISSDMIKMAERNAEEYRLDNRVDYVNSDAQTMPFDDNMFDGVFTNGSLHEWSQPLKIFNEIYRVLKSDGKYFLSDMRRDMNPFGKWFLRLIAKPKEIRPGLVSSINASYTTDEIQHILDQSKLQGSIVKKTFMGFEIKGKKG